MRYKIIRRNADFVRYANSHYEAEGIAGELLLDFPHSTCAIYTQARSGHWVYTGKYTRLGYEPSLEGWHAFEWLEGSAGIQ